jgi:predicted CoA-binding protein
MSNTQKPTLVIGASPNPARYSHRAVRKLVAYGHQPFALGLRKGNIGEIEIVTGTPELTDIHTITMYIGPERQPPLYNYILGLSPKRIIFNPGAENKELSALAEQQGILVSEACTLVLLSIGEY